MPRLECSMRPSAMIDASTSTVQDGGQSSAGQLTRFGIGTFREQQDLPEDVVAQRGLWALGAGTALSTACW